jgi:hypothetical protein
MIAAINFIKDGVIRQQGFGLFDVFRRREAVVLGKDRKDWQVFFRKIIPAAGQTTRRSCP